MKKALILGIFIMIIVVGLVLVNTTTDAKHSSNTKSIGVSTFALYDIASHLLPQEIDVFMVVPFGVDVHSFEPTPKDMVRIQESELFFYSGAGLEPWSHAFTNNKNSVNMSQYVSLIEMDKDHEHHHNTYGLDPHYWLSIANMQGLSEEMASQLLEAFPKYSKQITGNAKSYITTLKALGQKSKAMFLECHKKEIVVNHNAFGYLAHDYGFKIHALSGFSPDAMPSASNMARLVRLVKQEHIKTLFFESFVSDKLMRSIAKESGADIEVLQPLANISGDAYEAGEDYVSIMQTNITKLAEVLECQ